jgi:glycine/D-amino acid oxidase-like deaminating enzyme
MLQVLRPVNEGILVINLGLHHCDFISDMTVLQRNIPLLDMITNAQRVTQRRELGLSDVMVWDTERPYHYARCTPDDRLLMGGADRLVRPGMRPDPRFVAAMRQLRHEFEELLPALADIDVAAAWEGLFAMTPDSLPFIGPHRRYPRHLFALGYGGNGMTFATLAARLLLDYWTGNRTMDQLLFRFGRMR